MIKLNRPSEPNILLEKKADWTKDLLEAKLKYGTYKDIPEPEKNKLLAHYRHDDIKKDLFESTNYKCAFCECKPGEGGNIEVEHFHPKSIYTEDTFSWKNLLPSCRKCNDSKLIHDTKIEPIINPYDIDPMEHFIFEDIIIKEKMKGDVLAEKTIEVLGLNNRRVLTPRAKLLISLREFEADLKLSMKDLKEADTPRKKSSRIRKLSEALDTIDALMQTSEIYSSFCRSFIENCITILYARTLLQEERKMLSD